MPNPPKSYLLRLVILLATINLARTAPRQVIPLDLKELLGGFNFPEPQEKDQEIPEPRDLYVNLDVGQDGQQDDLRQVLLVTSGLSPTQIVQRQGDDQNLRNQGRHFFKNGATVFVFSGMNSGGITNNNTNNINTNATATPAAASTTATRNTEFIRAPIGYPAGLPMQYFRKRQDDALSPAVSYPDLFGWNEAAFYGGDLGGGYAGLGGLNGGYSPLAGVPLVPITIGNEVRYIPMNLRMYRQLARSPAPPPPPPAIREQDDQLEEDDMSAFGLAPQLDVMELEDVEQADEAAQGQGHSVAGSPGYGILGQRLRPRPLVRRRPLQSLAQNIRRVQYLKR